MDTAAYTDCVIPPRYDSLIAKLIACGPDRQRAVARMRRTPEVFVIEGIHTPIPLGQRIPADADFAAGRFGTNLVKRFQARPAAV